MISFFADNFNAHGKNILNSVIILFNNILNYIVGGIGSVYKPGATF